MSRVLITNASVVKLDQVARQQTVTLADGRIQCVGPTDAVSTRDADLVVLNDALEVEQTWIAGHCVYESAAQGRELRATPQIATDRPRGSCQRAARAIQ